MLNDDSNHSIIYLLLGLIFIGVVVVIYLAFNRSVNVVCNAPLMSPEACANECSGECIVQLTDPNSSVAICVSCQLPPEPEVVQEPACPAGFTDSESDCQAMCSNGACFTQNAEDGTKCFACVRCSEDAFNSNEACTQSCNGECYMSGSQHGLECYKCL